MKKHISFIIISIFLFVNCLMSQSNKVNKDEILVDQSGNTYKTVKIGNNVWMAENYRGKHFSNGDEINEYKLVSGEDLFSWAGFFIIMNNGNYVYSWDAIKDSRGIAPIGWHVPTKAEWEELLSVSKNLKDFKSISGWPSLKIGGYYEYIDCPNCKNWNSEYRHNKHGCDRCQDNKWINGKFTPPKVWTANGNNSLKFNIKNIGWINRANSKYEEGSNRFWTSEIVWNKEYKNETYSYYLSFQIYDELAGVPPSVMSNESRAQFLPVRLVKNKENQSQKFLENNGNFITNDVGAGKLMKKQAPKSQFPAKSRIKDM